MFKKHPIISLLLVLGLLTSCATPVTTVVPTASATEELMPPVNIARYPDTANFSGMKVYDSPPKYDPNLTDSWQVDLRSADLTKLDLSHSIDDLMYADFDSKTQWPATDKMSADFDWQNIMEIGKDPGLGMRALHEQGITGKGVGIAIIDGTLLVDHIEYKDRVRVYEEPESRDRGMYARMHGPAVASIAVGKTIGVAPEADLYYLASPSCFNNNDFECLARSVRRVIEINKTLPVDRKIRVLSISRGWSPNELGYTEIITAVKEASANGIFVISSSLGQTHGLYFHGLGREPLSDPNKFEFYLPGIWWAKNFYAGMPLNYSDAPSIQTLLVPMDSRTTASPTGTEDYVFYREGGWSWSIPYLAGTYALAVQVKPDITPEEFWAAALETGRTIQITHEGKEYSFGVILDPQALIAALQK
jgi:hypothetical protein